MTFLLLILLVVCLWGIRFPGYREDYLSPDSTTMIKGIFTFLILFSHARGYLTLSDSWTDTVYMTVQDHLGQLIVAMFLFYSGFGIWESFRKKECYGETFLSRRFLKILVHFDIAVALYIIAQAFIPVHYPARNYVLCWSGWEDVGNCNWFILDILCL
jgi:peptidoglycan/LPS O-acetylase OafA/YrhL